MQRHHPELLRPRNDGSLANLDLARHYLREALARDLPQVLSDNTNAMPPWPGAMVKRDPSLSSVSESVDQSVSETAVRILSALLLSYFAPFRACAPLMTELGNGQYARLASRSGGPYGPIVEFRSLFSP